MSAALDTSRDALTWAERRSHAAGVLLTRHEEADTGVTDLLREIERDAMMDAGEPGLSLRSVEALEIRHEAMRAAHAAYLAVLARHGVVLGGAA